MGLLSRVFGRDGPKEVLLNAELPHNFLTLRPVYERLRPDRERLRFWLTSKPPSGDPHEVFDPFGLSEEPMVTRGRARRRRYDFYLTANYRLVSKRTPVRIMFPHGVSLTNCFLLRDEARAFDRVFILGEYMRRRFIESGCFDEREAAERLVPVGFPKLDSLFDGSLDRKATLGRHGLDPSRPTVLFAPSIGEHSGLYRMGDDVVRLIGDMGLNLIVKLHDDLYRPGRYSVDWPARIAALTAGKPNVVLTRERDIVPYLHAADILISDFSSAANEFTLLDRPILFIDTPQVWETEKYSPIHDLKTWGYRTGTLVRQASELRPAVEAALAHPGALSEVRRAAAQDFFYNPGRATEAAVARLYEIFGLEPLA